MTPLANGLFTVLLVSAAVFADGDRPTTSTHWVLSDTGELKTGDLSEIYRLPADVPRYVLQHFQLLRMTCCPADGIQTHSFSAYCTRELKLGSSVGVFLQHHYTENAARNTARNFVEPFLHFSRSLDCESRQPKGFFSGLTLLLLLRVRWRKHVNATSAWSKSYMALCSAALRLFFELF